MSLRNRALQVLLETDPDEKSRLARVLDPGEPAGADEQIAEPAGACPAGRRNRTWLPIRS